MGQALAIRQKGGEPVKTRPQLTHYEHKPNFYMASNLPISATKLDGASSHHPGISQRLFISTRYRETAPGEGQAAYMYGRR